MIRRRGHGHQEEESSSDDEEDAFSAMSKKANAKKKAKHSNSSGGSSRSTTSLSFPSNNNESKSTTSTNKNSAAAPGDNGKSCFGSPTTTTTSGEFSSPTDSKRQKEQRVPKPSKTSSMKRHHKPSDTRKAKMDALLQELEAEKDQIPKKTKRFVPEKKGSFVDPDEEHLTTNLFVGNLAPSIAEEDLSNLFMQFVKIMWPRTIEEKNRRRNTGFVCFMNRDDAEEAMEACDDTDPFNNGRLLTLRWGKSVKKVNRRNNNDANPARGTKPSADQRKRETNRPEKLPNGASIDSSDASLPPTGARDDRSTTPSAPARNGFGKQPQQQQQQHPETKRMPPKVPPYDPEIHASRAIRVENPTDQSRFHFISTTASYIAKDPELEPRLRDEEKGNPLFSFLQTFGDDAGGNDEIQKERIFYRWRVYSFCQGDTYSIWRTEPFIMFPNGRYWIPPPLDADAVQREKASAAEKEYRQKQQKEDRANRDLMTGRQFERRKRRGDFGTNHSRLNPEELRRFDRLVRKQLSISRSTICEAMSFCFDNCMAAKEVSDLVKEALLDDSDRVTNDTRIARLYLLSDILFNSQQPGVRNAFMYRTTIESMAVEVFKGLGSIVRMKESRSGRITVNKLRKAVSAVLGAWTEWGVYNATFVDDLEAHFEGREVKRDSDEVRSDVDDTKEKSEDEEIYEDAEEVVFHGPLGDWKEVSNEDEDNPPENKKRKRKKKTQIVMDVAGAKASFDLKEQSIPTDRSQSDPQNRATDSRRDGSTESNEDEANIDAGAEELDGEELDGEELDGEDLDGEDLDGEDLDGEELDGEELDCEELYCEELD